MKGLKSLSLRHCALPLSQMFASMFWPRDLFHFYLWQRCVKVDLLSLWLLEESQGWGRNLASETKHNMNRAFIYISSSLSISAWVIVSQIGGCAFLDTKAEQSVVKWEGLVVGEFFFLPLCHKAPLLYLKANSTTTSVQWIFGYDELRKMQRLDPSWLWKGRPHSMHLKKSLNGTAFLCLL